MMIEKNTLYATCALKEMVKALHRIFDNCLTCHIRFPDTFMLLFFSLLFTSDPCVIYVFPQLEEVFSSLLKSDHLISANETKYLRLC